MKSQNERLIADACFPKGRTYSPPPRRGTVVYCLAADVRSCGVRETVIAMTKGGDNHSDLSFRSKDDYTGQRSFRRSGGSIRKLLPY